MNKYPRSCFFFPTVSLILDDNNSFLESMVLSLKGKFITKISIDAHEALDIINENSRNHFINNGYFDTNNKNVESDDEDTIVTMDFNIKEILKYVFNHNRYSLITNVILDYSMPKINGLDFCRHLTKSKIIKMMLTGEADLTTAVSAFNNGLINMFFQKGCENMMEQIISAINEAQCLYFEKISLPLLDAICGNCSHILKNDIYWDFFNTICNNHKIIEYYLLDRNGSFLLLDENAKPYWFIIRTEQDFISLYDIAIGNNAAKSVIYDIYKRKKIPLMLSESEQWLPVNYWSDYLYSVEHFPKMDQVYYTLIDKKNFGEIDFSNISSYKQYQRNL